MSEAKLEEHLVRIDSYGGGRSTLWHRWVCSCSRDGDWTRKARSARIGGQRHVAAMERGR